MAEVASVDDRGRIKLPKEMGHKARRVVIIDAGGYFLGIPIPGDPLQASGTWLRSEEDTRALKRIAEAEALGDAVSRARRRRQSIDD